MARVEVDPNFSNPTFSRATAATDLFKKEDVQNLAAAVSTHTHANGYGPAVARVAAGAIDAAAIPDGLITSAKIADGTIATADLANAAVTNIKLASDTARANLLTNGGFEIWQRGNGPFTSLFTADRWQIGTTGSDTLSVSRNSANAENGTYCAACTFTLGSGAGATYLGQKIEDVNQVRNRIITFSMRVYVTTANIIRLGIYTGSSYTYGAFHPGTGYQTISVTATIENSPGSVFANVFFAASCTAYLDNAMLVVGPVAADYAPLHPADDLARCLRYYERFDVSNTQALIGALQAYAATDVNGVLLYKVTKAVSPTVTYSAASTFAMTTSGGGTQAVTAISSFNVLTDHVQVHPQTASGLVAGNATMLIAAAGQNASVQIEANP